MRGRDHRIRRLPTEVELGQPCRAPAGTAIVADQAAAGHTYPANVTREIIGADGNVLVPKGAPAQLVVQGVELTARPTW